MSHHEQPPLDLPLDESFNQHSLKESVARAMSKFKCAVLGHDPEVTFVWQSLAPAKIVCLRCGESWTPGEDERPRFRGPRPKEEDKMLLTHKVEYVYPDGERALRFTTSKERADEIARAAVATDMINVHITELDIRADAPWQSVGDE